LKIPTILKISLIAGSFLVLVGFVAYLAAADVVTPQMALLIGISLFGFYIGFGILIGVYRLINKLN